MSAPRLLVADDQPDILEALKLLLKGEGFEVETAASPRSVLAAVEARDFDALLVDMNYTRDTTSGAEGLDLLLRVQGLESPPPVVVMTAWGSIDAGGAVAPRGWARHGGRGRCAAAARLVVPGGAADERGESGRHRRRAVRERAIRACARGVHRREGRPHRALRARRGRHAVPRRDRE